MKAAQTRQESGVASRLPWPADSSIAAAVHREARLHPWAKDEWAAKGDAGLAGFQRLSACEIESCQRDRSIVVTGCDLGGSQAVGKECSARDKAR